MKLNLNLRTRRYVIAAAIALMLVSVVVLADVIYYYKGQITAVASQSPLQFYNGTVTYSGQTYPLNSLAPGYANFTALPTGFTATIQLTNASYAYFYHALGLVVNTAGYLYVTNVTATGSGIESLTVYIQNTAGQTVCSFTVITNASPITSPTPACALSPGLYFISFLAQPVMPLPSTASETVTFYFGYNVVSSATVPLPPT